MPLATAASSGPEVRTGSIWIGNAYRPPVLDEPVEGSDFNPILHFYGAGGRIGFGRRLAVSPGLDFFFKDYLAVDGRAVPTQIETGRAAGQLAHVMGVAVSAPLSVRVFRGTSFHVDAGLSPTAILRLPIVPIEDSEVDQLWDYLLGNGRFAFPEATLALEYDMPEWLTFAFRVRAFAPVFRLWTDETELPFWDQLKLAAQLSLRYRLR